MTTEVAQNKVVAYYNHTKLNKILTQRPCELVALLIVYSPWMQNKLLLVSKEIIQNHRKILIPQRKVRRLRKHQLSLKALQKNKNETMLTKNNLKQIKILHSKDH